MFVKFAYVKLLLYLCSKFLNIIKYSRAIILLYYKIDYGYVKEYTWK